MQIMHDDLIISYEMNFRNKTLIIYTYNETQEKERKLNFFEVLTHSFENILDYNQILSVNNWGIDNFIKNNLEQLKKFKNYNWPINYQSIEELKEFFVTNHYKYIVIDSAYGMCGWVLAKDFQIS